MKVKALKTISAFGETITKGSFFEGDIKEFPKCIQKEIELSSNIVEVVEKDYKKEEPTEEPKEEPKEGKLVKKGRPKKKASSKK